MALLERFFPVTRHGHNFFDQFMSQMDREFQEMEQEMRRMRQRMYHLVPVELPPNMADSLPALESGTTPALESGSARARCDSSSDIKDVILQPKMPIVEERGQSKLKLEFNVQDFKPEEVVVKVVGTNILQIQAKHEVKTDTSHEYKTYFRQYQLPPTINVDTIKPSLTKDGVLTIEAPAPPLKPAERLIPVEYKK